MMRAIPIVLMLTFAGSLAGPAANAASPSIPAYSVTYSGTIGDKRVTISIDRFADHLTGSYFYGGNSRHPIALSGTLAGDSLHAAETVAGKVTGIWAGTLMPGSIRGTWSSPDRKRTLPLAAASAPAEMFPYDIRVVLAGGVDPAKVISNQVLPDACDSDQARTQVTAIELVDPATGTVAQSLGGDLSDVLSQGTCRLFLPMVEDMNFDGWPDLRIARFLPAGPNLPYAAWLFDPATRKLMFNADLSNLTSPEFDSATKRVTSTARDGCCSYTTEVYAWIGGHLHLIEKTRRDYHESKAGRSCYVERRYRPHNGKLQLVGTKTGCDKA